ncbi:CRISPR-associated protein Cas4 [Methanococcoides orientis]|uniref:CRISPR-associated protein Cas4 n=1 Tax=Methanococcoides orientis TaxID=2822137 RepID=UPI001E5F189C|nr:CRISPR-associated protein Cas4 [Methanococcoides orientis]UGV41622.1 CRISPR-associated protein Cas4 [Methanococcoides orientis]
MGSNCLSTSKDIPTALTPYVKITGVKINYYHICHTKLWLFSHNIVLEREDENVNIGKLLHEDRYSKNKKDITIDNTISIDFVKKRNDIIELHDIKKTKKMEDAHLRQMLYYIYYLKQRGIDAQGVMNYPLLNQTKEIVLTEDDEKKIENDIEHIEEIVTGRMPHPKRLRICSKCAYFEFCFCGEVDDD